jgi:hypothetical protein
MHTPTQAIRARDVWSRVTGPDNRRLIDDAHATLHHQPAGKGPVMLSRGAWHGSVDDDGGRFAYLDVAPTARHHSPASTRVRLSSFPRVPPTNHPRIRTYVQLCASHSILPCLRRSCTT